jgi:pSer/pThr/pTyr-binding forkhead associated (FHA) protein
MNASLVMFKADGTRRDFPLTKARIVVGRTNECDLRVPLSSVSRQHCEILVQDEQIKLRDLGSSNGTFQNDSRVQEAALQAGDEIGVGPVVFTLVIDGKPAKIAPVRTVVTAEPKAKAPAGGGAGTAPAKPAKKAASARDKDEVIPAFVDDANSPTVDLDDPIAALEAMSGQEGSSTTLPSLTDEDEEKPKKKK